MALAARRRRRRSGLRGRRPRRAAALTALLLVIAGVACAAIIAAALAPRVIASQCDLRSLKPLTIGTNSFVTAADGSLLGTIPAKRNRQQLTLAQMSPWLARASRQGEPEVGRPPVGVNPGRQRQEPGQRDGR